MPRTLIIDFLFAAGRRGACSPARGVSADAALQGIAVVGPGVSKPGDIGPALGTAN